MKSQLEIINTIIQNEFVALYFSSASCHVCESLKPKLLPAIMERYPLFLIEDIDGSEHPSTAAQFNVFSAPTLIIFIQGKETFRKTRHMSVSEILNLIERPYDLSTI